MHNVKLNGDVQKRWENNVFHVVLTCLIYSTLWWNISELEMMKLSTDLYSCIGVVVVVKMMKMDVDEIGSSRLSAAHSFKLYSRFVLFSFYFQLYSFLVVVLFWERVEYSILLFLIQLDSFAVWTFTGSNKFEEHEHQTKITNEDYVISYYISDIMLQKTKKKRKYQRKLIDFRFHSVRRLL